MLTLHHHRATDGGRRRAVARALGAAVVVALLAAVAVAKPRSFLDRRDVSPSGRTYLVAKRAQRVWTIELCTRRADAPPMKPAEAGAKGVPPVDRDADDPVVASGTIDSPPVEIRVIDGAPRAILLSYDGLRVVDARGVGALRTPVDLLGSEEKHVSPPPDSDATWFRGSWTDDARGVFVVVTPDDRFAEIDLADGTISRPDARAVFVGFESPVEDERNLALDVAARLRPGGLASRAEAIAADETAPFSVRLRAAVAAKSAGGDGDYAALFRAGMSAATPDADRKYAFEHVVAGSGADVVVLLRDASRGPFPHGDVQSACELAWASIGAEVVPELARMLATDDAPDCYRYTAAFALQRIGTPAAFEALYAATRSGSKEALTGLTYRDPKPADLAPRLAKILERGGPLDYEIANWFRFHPFAGARAGLDAALERAKPKTYQRDAIVAALDALDAAESRPHVERLDPAEAARRAAAEAKKRAEEEARLALIPPHGDSFVAGRVTDENGRPIGGIDVVAQRKDGPANQPWREHGRNTTDAAGRFRIERLADGEFCVALDVNRFRTGPGGGTLPPGGGEPSYIEHAKSGATDLELRFEIGATIRGRLVDERGAPLARMTVVAAMIDPPMRFAYGENVNTSESVKTDTAAVFWAIRLRPGHYRLTTPSQGPKGKYLVTAGGEDVATGADGVTLVAGEGAKIGGIVVDERGDPIEGALVSAGNATMLRPQYAKSDGGGSFDVSGLVPGARYGVGACLAVPRDDLNATSSVPDVAAGVSDLRIVITTGKRISFRFVRPDGKPLAVERVRAVHVASGREVTPVRTATGFLVRGVADGTWRIEVPGKVPDRTAPQWVTCGEIEAGREDAALVVPE